MNISIFLMYFSQDLIIIEITHHTRCMHTYRLKKHITIINVNLQSTSLVQKCV